MLGGGFGRLVVIGRRFGGFTRSRFRLANGFHIERTGEMLVDACEATRLFALVLGIEASNLIFDTSITLRKSVHTYGYTTNGSPLGPDRLSRPSSLAYQ